MCTAAGNCSTGLGLGSASRDREETGLLALVTPRATFSLKTAGHPRAQEQMSAWRTPTMIYSRFGCCRVTSSKSHRLQTLQFPGCKTSTIMFRYLVKLLIHGEGSARQQHFPSPSLTAGYISPLQHVLARTPRLDSQKTPYKH